MVSNTFKGKNGSGNGVIGSGNGIGGSGNGIGASGNGNGCGNGEAVDKCRLVGISDRKSHLEAMTLSFVAENSLPLSIVPKLIDLAKELGRDPKALNSISMERTSATYKLKDGLSYNIENKLIENLKKSFFSLNMDECTSSNMHKVFSILVCFFDEAHLESVVHHLASVDLTVVNSEVLFNFIMKIFDDNGIPKDNLISDLSDSTNYMRGKISGLETRLRAECPQLLDIDGDVCHHVHNTVRLFCKQFGQLVEHLLDDLFTDFKYSPDLREALSKICSIMKIKYRKPPQRVAHRWLSTYDVTVVDLEMMDALVVFYYAFLKKGDKDTYKDVMIQMLKKNKVEKEKRKDVYEILGTLSKKSLTKDGQKRKQRIIEALLIKPQQTLVEMNLFKDVLPMFKSFILIFEQKEPMIHRLFDELTELMRTFLVSFIKHDVIKPLNGKQLLDLDVTKENNFIAIEDIFVGQCTTKILNENPQIKETFLPIVRKAYTETAKYIQKKFPLNNKVLRYFSAIDPKAQGHSLTYSALKKLIPYFPTVIRPLDEEEYLREISNLQIDRELPSVEEFPRLDHWWAQIFKSGKYPTLSKLIKASLSIFTGPHIEQSFSIMNDIINPKTNRMNVSTYAAIQNVKYELKSQKKTSLALFHRKDILRSPVDRQLMYHMQTAYGRHNRKRQAEAESSESSEQPKKKQNVHEVAKKIKSKFPFQNKLQQLARQRQRMRNRKK